MTHVDGLEQLLAALVSDGEAVWIPVQARPGAQREGILGVHAGALKVATSAAPEGGKATARIGKLLARALGVAPSRVSCSAGFASRSKRFRIEGVSLADCAARLREVCL